jgi:hypothetical protein
VVLKREGLSSRNAEEKPFPDNRLSGATAVIASKHTGEEGTRLELFLARVAENGQMLSALLP